MQYYRQVVRLLKKKCPADMPVKVRRLKVPDDRFGDCDQMEDHYFIRISNELEEEQAIDILLHEYSHALSWDKCASEDHCNEWGKAYSKVYRIFVKFILEN